MSEPTPFQSDAAISVIFDFKSPRSYLALGPSLALFDELSLDAEWLPFDAPPLKPPQQTTAGSDRGSRHRATRSRYWQRDIERYARVQGLVLKDMHRAPDSSLAGIGLLFVREKVPEAERRYLQRTFERYWDASLDIEDPGAIAQQVAECGGDAGAFAAYCEGPGRAAYLALQARLAESGFFEAPFYCIDGEMFFGREHLPMIRWILGGREGAPPL